MFLTDKARNRIAEYVRQQCQYIYDSMKVQNKEHELRAERLEKRLDSSDAHLKQLLTLIERSIDRNLKQQKELDSQHQHIRELEQKLILLMAWSKVEFYKEPAKEEHWRIGPTTKTKERMS